MIARRSPVPRRRATPRRSERVVDMAYLAWCRAQPCSVGVWLRSFKDCRLPIDPHHAGRHVHGLGAKPNDDTAMPACRRHHDDLQFLTGPFKGWGDAERQAWQDREIARHRSAYLADRLLAYPGEARW
mgnify:CR=1 FL=1